MKRLLLAIFILLAAAVSDASAATLYRSVGTTATDLKSAATVTISGTTATFSAAQPNNVGVGDAIVYGSTYIAFITGRTSSSVFTVQSSTGGTPTAAGAGTAVAIYRCFISLANWEGNVTANTNINATVRASVLQASTDLVAAGHIMMVPCYADGADTAVTVDSWTTGASNYIKIYTPTAYSEVGVSQRHNGTWGNGYRITGGLILSEEYMRIDGLSVQQTGAGRIYLVNGSTAVGEVQISNCFGWYTTNNSSFDVFDIWQAGDLVVKIWNCIGITDSTDTTSEAFYQNDASSTAYFYNCTGIANAGRAFYMWQGTGHIKNSIGYSASSSAFLGSFSTVTYSASDDATADDWSGAGARINQTFSFMNSASQDQHIKPTDAGARNYGTNLSADAVIPFSTDIDGDTRPLDSTWDIGADEADAVNIYRSVGTTATNLNTSNRTVTISGNTATFSGVMPTNVGVGDALVYGSTNIAFISGRTSSTVFTLQDATGGSPVATGAGTSVAVYRVYQSLTAWEANTLGQENANINAAVDDYVILPSTDLAALGHIMMVPCYADGVDSTPVTIDWTTGASNYIKIYTPVSLSEVGVTQRHNGKWDTNAYHRIVSNDRGINVLADHVRIDGLQVYINSTSGVIVGEHAITFENTNAGTDWRASNNILRGTTSSYAWHNGLEFYKTSSPNAGTAYAWNNIIYDFRNSTDIGSYANGIKTTGSNMIVYASNNTIYNCTYNYENHASFTSVFHAKNNISLAPGYANRGFWGGGFSASSTHNASDDGSAPDTNEITLSSSTVTDYFVSASDFHVNASATYASQLINSGTSLSADANLPFSDDIDGESRPIGGTWDIGADEAVGLTTIYRSVGTTATDLKNAATVTISGTTATFSAAQPDNIGVGDAIVYGSTYIAFISGRTSSTVYTVQSATGGTPTAAGAGTSVAVYRSFTSLANWEANTTANANINAAVRSSVLMPSLNLVSLGYILMVPCYGGGTDTASVSINGWTTGPSNTITVYTPTTSSQVGVSQRHSGKWDTNKYVLAVTNQEGIGIRTPYTRVEGLQVQMVSANDNNDKNILIATSASGPVYVVSNICYGSSSTVAWADGIEPWYSGIGDVFIYNNILYNFQPSGGGGAIEVWSPDTTVYIYNNTIYNSIAGVRSDTSAGVYAKNNLVTDSTTAMMGTFSTGTDYNATNNASMGYTVTGGGNTHDRVSQTFSFVDKAGYDLHLLGSDAAAMNYGVSLSADPKIPFTVDIDGDSRPIGASWDIGADEAYGLVTLYRSVGTTATDLNTSSRTVTISGSTATFSGVMPSNVGVGDAVVYGSANIAFISGRTSSTVFTVQNATGGVPTATGAGTSVSVYRCYQSLAAWEANTLGQENPNIDAAVDDSVILPSTDLVTSAYIMMVPCYADGEDTVETDIEGWTTGAGNYIKIYTPTAISEVGLSQRHSGKWGDGYRKTNYIWIHEEYVRLDGISVSESDFAAFYIGIPGSSAGEIQLSNCFGLVTAGTSAAFHMFGVGPITVKVWNCIGINKSASAGNTFGFLFYDADATVYVYNSTGIGNVNPGILADLGTTTIKNCLVYSSSSSAIGGSYASVTYSASDDATADDWAGAGNRINQTFTFIDSANDDFHLAAADAGAREYGTSLAADAIIPFSTDIDGESRAIGTSWDIGADEAVGLTSIYRSVGITATDLKTAASTVTISGTTATFSTAQPNNIGVGDAIVYGSTYIAFITGRTSSTVYTVQSATGGAPTAAGAGTSVAVYRSFTSLANWEANTTANANINAAVRPSVLMPGLNLVSLGYVLSVPCYADGEDVTAVTVDGWTTGASNYIRIYTPSTTAEAGITQRHNGTWGNGFRMSSPLIVSDNYVRLDGLSMVQNIDASRGFFVTNITGTGEIQISNCFSWVNHATSHRDGFDFLTLDAIVVKIWNNIAISDSTYVGSYGYIFNDADMTVYSYNNTAIVNGGQGFYHPGATVYMKNCLSQSASGSAYALSAGTYNMTYSASDDATADDWGGVGNRINQTFSFADAANDNFHLTASDTGAREYGTSLVADAIIPFSTDIDGQSRPVGAAWDIGADEAVGLTSIYRSVGTTATNLNTSSHTVTISGNTATFSGDMPNNVGVGDALVYGSTNIAFISGRTSPTVFTLQDATGGLPVSTGAGTAVSIYRCYTRLDLWERNILGNENPNIPAAVDDYVILSSTDLIAGGRTMMVPCYADGVDTGQMTLDGWTTGPNNYIKIYTPVASSEVGVSQRHTGKWGDGYRKDDFLVISEEYVIVDGISVYQNSGNRTFFVSNATGAGEVHISNCFGWYTYTSSYDVFDVFTVGALVVKFWNCIGVTDSTNTTSDAFYFNDVDASVYCFNCTGIANAGRAFRSDFSTAPAVLKNCLGYSASNSAFSGTFTSVTYSSSDDGTADDWAGAGNRIDQTFSFADAANDDFHLAASDAGAREYGTSLVADAIIPFSLDIDGDPRPIGAIWDIGADETQMPGVGSFIGMEY